MAAPRYGAMKLLLLLLNACRGAGLEVVADIPQGRRLALSCKGPALRLRLASAAPLETPMLDPGLSGSCTEVQGKERGVSTAAGSLTVDQLGVVRLRTPGGVISSIPVRSDQMIGFYQKKRLFGGGSSSQDSHDLTSTKVIPMVGNTGVYTPHYYSEDGYAALAVLEKTDKNKYPAVYEMKTFGSSQRVYWYFTGAWDLYLMPAQTLREGTQALYTLTGRPPVPPRYAFGFMASRWGWQDRVYIEDTLQQFRDGQFPLDAIIMDFEWFTNETDYGYAPGEGQPYYQDFGFRDVLFPEPKYQLADYLQRYHVRVAGIRKPRMGNSKLLQELDVKRWLTEDCEPSAGYPPSYPGYACGRHVNFSDAAVRDWYSGQMQPLINAGMAFWWNDEGEHDYFAFHHWNVAQKQALEEAHPKRRFFSLNRAFSPGMARLGAAVWTGDVLASWDWLRNTPGTMLKWVLAGHPMVGCDSGGFVGETSGELLVRWLQVAAFMPIMRVHSELKVKPHWPWLWGKDAANAMRQILNLRYRLLPYHYSLAHAQYETGDLWIKPLAMDFPDDPEVNSLTTQWMDGSILVAPVLNEDSSHEVHLPRGLWYRLDKVLQAADQTARKSLKAVVGRRTETRPQLVAEPSGSKVTLSLDEVPCYVRPGTILPLSSVVQHSDDIGNTPLEVFIFGGADGEFKLVEDDGWSTNYMQGAKRSTQLTWSDASKTLSWQSSGAPPEQGFTAIAAYLIDVEGNMTKAPTKKLMTAGTISFKAVSTNTIFQ